MAKFKWIADYLAVLACPTRIQILEYLKGGPKQFSEIQKHLRKYQTTVSRQLKILYTFKIIDRKYLYRVTEYRILDKNVFKVLKAVPRKEDDKC